MCSGLVRHALRQARMRPQRQQLGKPWGCHLCQVRRSDVDEIFLDHIQRVWTKHRWQTSVGFQVHARHRFRRSPAYRLHR